MNTHSILTHLDPEVKNLLLLTALTRGEGYGWLRKNGQLEHWLKTTITGEDLKELEETRDRVLYAFEKEGYEPSEEVEGLLIKGEDRLMVCAAEKYILTGDTYKFDVVAYSFREVKK